jgi:hypothetical protein
MSVPFRVMAGGWAIPAYTMKGLYQQMMKEKGAGAQNYIIAARVSQGYEEASTISATERADIVSRWKCLQLDVKKNCKGDKQAVSLQTFMEQKKIKKQRSASIQGCFKRATSSSTVLSAMDRSNPNKFSFSDPRGTTAGSMNHANTSQSELSDTQLAGMSAEGEKEQLRQMEAAVQGSVSETSRGNADEDELLARAIRASIAEFQREPEEDENEEQVLERVMTASLQEAQRAGATEEEQHALEETLRQSLLHTTGRRGSDSEWDSDDDSEDEDYQRVIAESQKLADQHHQSPNSGAAQAEEEEQLKLALQQSEQAHKASQQAPNEEEELLRKALEESEQLHKETTHTQTKGGDEEELLRKAMEESAQAEKQRLSEMEKQKTEEDIVLEYVKKQSLAEEQHRMRSFGGRDTHGESSRGGGGGRPSGAGNL